MPKTSFRMTHLLQRGWRASVVLAALWMAALHPALRAQTAVDANGRLMLEAEVQLWLARHQGVDPQQIHITPLDARLRVPSCPDGWQITLPFNNTQSVRARCDSVAPARQYILRTTIQALAQEVVTRTQLSAGHVLQAEDLGLRPVLPGQAPVFSEIQALVGRALRIDVPRDVTLLPEDLSRTVTVYRLARSVFAGDPVQRQDVVARQVPPEQAPEGFWSATWPQHPIINRSLPAGHTLRTDDWATMVPAVVAQADIPRGTVLTPDMLRLSTLPAPNSGAPYVDNIAQLAYSETVRPIARGDAIGKLDVRAAILVKRGSKVMISVGRGRGFEISTLVEALEDGRLGEQIRLINRQSGRIISGTVTAANQVQAL